MSSYATVASVGVDVHYKSSTVCMVDSQAKTVVRETLDHSDRQALRRLLRQWPRVPIVMEASFGWGWLADEMKAAGLSPHLANCFKVEKMRQARGLEKNNRIDARLLSLLPLEPENWWEVWMAPPAVRDKREWMRYRTSLVAHRTQTKNRITAILHRYGVVHGHSDLFGADGMRFLARLTEDSGIGDIRLLDGAAAALRGYMLQLMHLREAIDQVESQLKAELDHSELACRLDSIPGIGLILAHTLIAEIGQIRRFRNHRALAKYSCLTPRVSETGEPQPGRKPKHGRVGNRGNITLKWAFREAAHGAVRSGGRWRKLFDERTNGGDRDRGIGYTKVARSLAAVVFAIWRDGTFYRRQPPRVHQAKATTNSKKQQRGRDHSPRHRMQEFMSSTRPGTGQPSRPMVADR